MSDVVVRGSLRKKVRKPGSDKATYAFLKCDDGADDCFMLPTAFIDGSSFEEVQEGQRLEFEPFVHVDERTGEQRGRRARNVRVIES
jgi:cold shock CspA family protein